MNMLCLGNKASAETTEFLVKKGITHLVNCADGDREEGKWDLVRPDVEKLEKHGINVLQLKVGWQIVNNNNLLSCPVSKMALWVLVIFLG